MSNRKSQAWTKADSEQKDQDIFVSQHRRKPNVACWLSSVKFVLLLWLIEIIVIVTICCFLPENQNWYVALFANGIGVVFGFILEKLHYRSVKKF